MTLSNGFACARRRTSIAFHHARPVGILQLADHAAADDRRDLRDGEGVALDGEAAVNRPDVVLAAEPAFRSRARAVLDAADEAQHVQSRSRDLPYEPPIEPRR